MKGNNPGWSKLCSNLKTVIEALGCFCCSEDETGWEAWDNDWRDETGSDLATGWPNEVKWLEFWLESDGNRLKRAIWIGIDCRWSASEIVSNLDLMKRSTEAWDDEIMRRRDQISQRDQRRRRSDLTRRSTIKWREEPVASIPWNERKMTCISLYPHTRLHASL